MKFHSRLLAYVCLGVAVCATAQAAPEVPMYITNAVVNPLRPQDDREQDANRKPEEVLAFTAVKSGQHIVDLMPGSGYFTRIFSKIVGVKGKVYALQSV